jgi:tetratricopeptide (TPR) repeat protein
MNRPSPRSALFGLPLLAIVFILAGSFSCAQGGDSAEPVEPVEATGAETNDAQLELVDDLISRASSEASDFRREGGTVEDPEHPMRDWSDLLWRYRVAHPGTAAAAQATQAALSMKGRLGEIDEMYDLAGQVDPDSAMWKENTFLLYTAWEEQDFDPVLELSEQKIAAASDPEIRSALQVLRGNVLLANGQRDDAIAALESAAEEAPDSEFAEDALDIKRVATELAPGQPAQWPEVSDTQGNLVSLDDFAGDYLLLNYWASW